MNTEKLKDDVLEHKNKLNDKYSESVEITIPFFLLNNLMLQEINKIQMSKFNISNSEFDVLITTYVSGLEDFTITPTILYDKLLFSTGAITKLLNKLESKELITRIDNTNDKRSKLLKLTQKGIKLCEDVFVEVTNFQENIYKVLTKNEKEVFIKALYKMLKQI